MNSVNCSLFVTSSLLVLLLMDKATAGTTNGCVFQCVKGMIKCSREYKIPGLLPEGTDCCAMYEECYLTCDPSATSVPSCTNPKRKRGSWNKRGGLPSPSSYFSNQGAQLQAAYQQQQQQQQRQRNARSRFLRGSDSGSPFGVFGGQDDLGLD